MGAGAGGCARRAVLRKTEAPQFFVRRLYLAQGAAEVARGALAVGLPGAQTVKIQKRDVPVVRGDEPVGGLRRYEIAQSAL